MSCCTKIMRKIQAKEIEVDDLGKAKQFRLFSIARPHMRSFHASWFCFFVAFTSWFGIQPLLPTIRKELELSKTDLANSGIASVAATIAVRVIIGPMCDKFGPRKIMCSLLITGAIPMALAGLIKTGTGLIVLRLFVGILGGTFVPCQFWTSAMYNSKIVGTANAIARGWGNLGGGFTFILMPGLFQLIKVIGADEFMAWKLAVVVPSLICVLTGISIIFTSDDCPQGHWDNRLMPTTLTCSTDKTKQTQGVTNQGFEHTSDEDGNASKAVSETHIDGKKFEPSSSEIRNNNEKHISNQSNRFWSIITILVLVIQYGMCFGVEIAVNTVMNLYFLYNFKKEGCVEWSNSFSNITITTMKSEVKEADTNECSILGQDTASLIASLFGLMNLFARAMGGIYSDIMRKYLGIAGRLVAQFTCLVCEGIMLIIFSQMSTISTSIAVMIFFSMFVQMSEGTTFAIVPYVLPSHVGIVAGLVGAGGNAGALVWNTLWRQFVEQNPSQWFWLLGIIVLSGSLLTFLIEVQEKRIWNVFLCCKHKERKYTI
ncbi:uncharacterized protein LOC134684385 [Mytilus trossulus]|uniref:uncharacterized protein LOC134684385 n=1 Tax=Mytilus trossulus TaxID=6551 RepID=UPI00300548DC